jgi:tetratricopeptide (TPR) repeat protein
MYRGMLITNKKAYADSTETYKNIVNLLDNNNYLNQLSMFDDTIINKQLNSDMELAKTYNNIGYCLAMQENYEEAQHYLNKAIKISPSYTEAINNLKVVSRFINN